MRSTKESIDAVNMCLATMSSGIQQRELSFIGRLIVGWIGLAWSVASIFAIPILVREPSLSNPFAVLSKSADTINRTWGEMLSG